MASNWVLSSIKKFIIHLHSCMFILLYSKEFFTSYISGMECSNVVLRLFKIVVLWLLWRRIGKLVTIKITGGRSLDFALKSKPCE